MYNIAKVAKGEILLFFNEIFDALAKVSASLRAVLVVFKSNMILSISWHPIRSYRSKTARNFLIDW